MENKCKRAEIMNITFSDRNATKIIIRKGTWKDKSKIIWKLNNMILQNQLKNKSQKELIISLKRMTMMRHPTKICGMQPRQYLEEN